MHFDPRDTAKLFGSEIMKILHILPNFKAVAMELNKAGVLLEQYGKQEATLTLREKLNQLIALQARL